MSCVEAFATGIKIDSSY